MSLTTTLKYILTGGGCRKLEKYKRAVSIETNNRKIKKENLKKNIKAKTMWDEKNSNNTKEAAKVSELKGKKVNKVILSSH